jgi:hypothetical protein
MLSMSLPRYNNSYIEHKISIRIPDTKDTPAFEIEIDIPAGTKLAEAV